MEAAFKQNSVEKALSSLKVKKAEQKLPAIYSDQDYANDLDTIFGKVSLQRSVGCDTENDAARNSTKSIVGGLQ